MMKLFPGFLTLMTILSFHFNELRSSKVFYSKSNSGFNIQDSTEEKAISKILSLPEVKARNKYIDSVTNHKRGIAIMVMKKPLHKEDYFWIQAGNNNEFRFEPIYNFYVYLRGLRVTYFDPLNNEVLSLEKWRKKRAFN